MFGILERAKKFAKEATNYISSIVSSDNESKPVQKKKDKSVNSVTNPENKTVAKPVDTFEKETPATKAAPKTPKTNETKSSKLNETNNTDFNNKTVTKKDVLQKHNEIEKLKEKYNITDEEFYEVILPKIGYSREQFLKLSPEKQMKELHYISGGTNLYIYEKYKDDPNFDKAEILANAAADLKKAQEDGGIKNAKEFDKAVKPYIEKINKDFANAKTEEEQINVLMENRQNFENDINVQREAALKVCKTDAQRAMVNNKFNNRIEAFEGYIQTSFIAKNASPKKAFMSTYLRSSKNMVDGYNRAVKSFSCNNRCTAAGSFTHTRRIQQLEYYNNAGDPISAEVYGECTQIAIQYMKKEDIEQYESDAYNFKKEYCKNPKKYSFITEEHLTQETVGMGMGAVLNKNMTASEKAEFLKTWNEHAQQFSDYDEVRGQFYTKVKQYLESHPDAKQGIEDIKRQYQEKYGSNPNLPRAAQKRYDSMTQRGNNTLKTNDDDKNIAKTQEKHQKQNGHKALPTNASAKDIAQAVKSGKITITDAIAHSKEKALDAIFEDPDLFNRNLVIAKLHINNHRRDLQKLLELSKFSSAVKLIVKNISPTIKNEYAQKVQLSGITKDAIFGKDEQYAA